MIKPIVDLVNCLEVFQRGNETVVIEFDLTEENCPDRGRASLPYESDHKILVLGSLVKTGQHKRAKTLRKSCC